MQHMLFTVNSKSILPWELATKSSSSKQIVKWKKTRYWNVVFQLSINHNNGTLRHSAALWSLESKISLLFLQFIFLINC